MGLERTLGAFLEGIGKLHVLQLVWQERQSEMQHYV